MAGAVGGTGACAAVHTSTARARDESVTGAVEELLGCSSLVWSFHWLVSCIAAAVLNTSSGGASRIGNSEKPAEA